MAKMFEKKLRIRKPGLFVTGTDTGVGKTVITCAIARALRFGGKDDVERRVGVCKPLASGCRHEREGLVSDDAIALAYFADSRQPLDIINPVRYRQPLSPAAAAEAEKRLPDWSAVARSLELLDATSDVMLVEGVGGLLSPLGPVPDRDAGKEPKRWLTVLDLILALRYPVVVVARAGLGTVNHTAMTVRLLHEAGCKVAGVVVNGFEADEAAASDPSMAGNRQWITRMTGVPVLAVAPKCDPKAIDPVDARIPGEILEAVGMVDWWEYAGC